MTAFEWLCMGIVRLAGVVPAIRRQFYKPDEKLVREFRARFPRSCMICSLHRWGHLHGFDKSPTPPEHDCIEK